MRFLAGRLRQNSEVLAASKLTWTSLGTKPAVTVRMEPFLYTAVLQNHLHTKMGNYRECFSFPKKKIIQLGWTGACWHDLIALLQLLSRVNYLFITVVQCFNALHVIVGLVGTRYKTMLQSLCPWETESHQSWYWPGICFCRGRCLKVPCS